MHFAALSPFRLYTKVTCALFILRVLNSSPLISALILLRSRQASEAVNAATQSAQSLKAELAAAVNKAAEAEAAAEVAAQKGASEHARALSVGAELAVAKATLTKFRNDLAQAKVRISHAQVGNAKPPFIGVHFMMHAGSLFSALTLSSRVMSS